MGIEVNHIIFTIIAIIILLFFVYVYKKTYRNPSDRASLNSFVNIVSPNTIPFQTEDSLNPK